MRVLIILAALICFTSATGFFPSWFGFPSDAKRCRQASDCEVGQCCVHGGLAKRFLLDSFDLNTHMDKLLAGTCQSLKKEGDFCVPFAKEMSIFNTKAHFASCPCGDGLTCTSDVAVKNYPVFGKLETHTEARCSETEGSGDAGNF